ncbi:tail fiber domain-containing protein [Myxococcus sp. K15C18031901]|uniref:tail fiber domain-containing protein n=1 Tax=Myxococcus dinghuensis TaxID=2906761 RepID=UPI0020A7A926|nr:tail fiber domain-containing protein [Myxococcus dinghuensis]MCP3103793.1 tail fiber domain-containing protein [Myxococcus dinghuensis]
MKVRALLATLGLVTMGGTACSGSDGSNGVDGRQGTQGVQGPTGPQGPQGPVGPSWDVGTGLLLQDNVLSVRYGEGENSAVASGDPRLANARIPLPGSDDYIQNGTTTQAGSFALSGTGQTQGRLTTKSDLRVDATSDPAKATPLLQVLSTSTTPSWTGFPLLTVDSAGGLLARGEQMVGRVPMSGAGIRMMWLPHLGAFRAGYADTQWNDGNIGTYSFAVGNLNTASGQGATAFGESCSASGTNATCLGVSNNASGSASLASGTVATAAGRAAVAMGGLVTANGDYSIAMGRAVSTKGYAGTFIWGDNSTATVAESTEANQFTVRAIGGIRLRTSSSLSTGCNLYPNSGAFECTSDRDVKEDFRPVDREALLRKVAKIPVETWRFKGTEGGVRHLGPVAQDFHEAFGLGSSDRSIGMLDINGVNMAAIQALELRTRELAAKTAEVDALKAEMAELRQGLSELRQALGQKAPRP